MGNARRIPAVYYHLTFILYRAYRTTTSTSIIQYTHYLRLFHQSTIFLLNSSVLSLGLQMITHFSSLMRLSFFLSLSHSFYIIIHSEQFYTHHHHHYIAGGKSRKKQRNFYKRDCWYGSLLWLAIAKSLSGFLLFSPSSFAWYNFSPLFLQPYTPRES